MRFRDHRKTTRSVCKGAHARRGKRDKEHTRRGEKERKKKKGTQTLALTSTHTRRRREGETKGGTELQKMCDDDHAVLEKKGFAPEKNK